MSQNRYLQKQVAIFVCLYVGYAIYVYVRKSFSFSAAAISQNEGLGKSDLGLIASSQALAYTIGKFSCGILVDSFSAKWLFALGLLLSGASNLFFAGSEGAWLFSLFWFINGLAEGPGWPVCVKFLKTWYPADQLGTLWSTLSTAMNVAGSLGPLLAVFLINRVGWRLSMCLPGGIAVLFSVLSLLILHDKPSDVGLPNLLTQSGDHGKKNDDRNSHVDNKTLLDVVNPLFIKVCLSYLVTLCIRSGCQDWGQLYLIQDLGHSHIVGSGYTSSMEVGGILGSVVAGYLSDIMAKKTPIGRRLVLFVNTVITSLSLWFLLSVITSASSQVQISAVGFSLGFSLYGCIALYGVMAVESAPLHLSGTTHSIAAACANVGMVLSGLPLSRLADIYQWEGAFRILLAVSLLPCILSLKSMVFSRTKPTGKME